MSREAIERHIAEAAADGDRFHRDGFYWLARVRWADAVHLRAMLRSMVTV